VVKLLVSGTGTGACFLGGTVAFVLATVSSSAAVTTVLLILAFLLAILATRVMRQTFGRLTFGLDFLAMILAIGWGMPSLVGLCQHQLSPFVLLAIPFLSLGLWGYQSLLAREE